MEESKKIINCPQCENKIRIPSDKHIRFLCPHCSNKFEYKNGEQIINQDCNDFIEPPKTSLKQPALEKKFWRTSRLVILFLSIVFLGLIIYWMIPRQPKSLLDQIDTSSVNQSSNTAQNLDTFTISEKYPDYNIVKYSDKDSLIKEKLKDFLQDLSENILEELFDAMTEEAENGQWEKANEWYEKTTQTMEQSGKKGKDLLKKYEGKLALIKNKIISQNPDKNDLPNSELTDGNEIEGETATEEIRNETIFALTLYYTGQVSKIVTIPPNGFMQVKLPKGTYNIVAKVSAPLVDEYYGTRTYGGFHYANRYYLSR